MENYHRTISCGMSKIRGSYHKENFCWKNCNNTRNPTGSSEIDNFTTKYQSENRKLYQIEEGETFGDDNNEPEPLSPSRSCSCFCSWAYTSFEKQRPCRIWWARIFEFGAVENLKVFKNPFTFFSFLEQLRNNVDFRNYFENCSKIRFFCK